MTVERSGSPPRVYLDMNVWVAMTRGLADGNARWDAAYRGLLAAVAEGRASVFLAVAHYMELWHRSDQRSREQVGGTMRDVSGYRTISPPYQVRRQEVRRNIAQSIAQSVNPAYEDHIFGVGANHAFNSQYGRFRFVESLASQDGATKEGPSIAPPDIWATIERSGPAWEWLQLVGTTEILELDGLDRTPEHRHGTSQRIEELELRKRLIRNSTSRDELWDLLVMDEVVSLLDDINEFCDELQTSPLSLFLNENLPGSPRDKMHAFVAGLPSAYTWARLRFWKHRDLTHPWEQHDWTDISTLSVAIPYCDFVLTERSWAHLAKVSGLTKRFHTQVDHGLNGVESLLTRIQ